MAAAPVSSAMRPTSRNVDSWSSTPLRTLTVTGTAPAASTVAVDDRVQQPGLHGEGGATAVPGDLAHRAAEVEVDVVDVALLDQPTDRGVHGAGIGAVELDAPGRLVGVEGGQVPAARAALDQATGVDHLADVEAGAVPAAQAPERGVGDPGHGRQDDRRPHLERPDRQRGELAGSGDVGDLHVLGRDHRRSWERGADVGHGARVAERGSRPQPRPRASPQARPARCVRARSLLGCEP